MNIRKNSLKLLIGFLWMPLVSTAGIALADEIPVEEVEISTPMYQPELNKLNLKEGSYTYTVTWQGIPAAEAVATFYKDGPYYKARATAKTYSGIDIFYKLRYQAESTLKAKDFSPIHSSFVHQENSKVKNLNIDFLENGDIRTVRTQKGKDAKSLLFNPNNFTLDPFSAAMIARAIDWELGKKVTLDTFNGKSRYLVELTALDKKEMEFNGQVRPVWVISPKVNKLTDPKANGKLREAKIYLSADGAREVLQIVSEVFVGSVKTTMKEFKPLTGDAKQAYAQNGDDHKKS